MGAELGPKFYLLKDYCPMDDRIEILQTARMTKVDPFIRGFKALLAMRPDLKASRISLDAGYDDSTLRKLLAGTNASPRVETAEALAKAAGYSLSTIIALGRHPNAPDVLAVLEKFEKLDQDGQAEAESYLDYLLAKKDAL